MRSFQEYYLTEDEKDDAEYRAEANKVYRTILVELQRITKRRIIDTYFALIPPNGGYMAYASFIGAEEYKSLVIFFAPKKSGYGDTKNSAGLFGFWKNKPVIVLKVLNKNDDELSLVDRFDKTIFVHEFIHYLDWRRYSPKKQMTFQTGHYDIQGVKAYVNDPSEFNAFYQDSISKVENSLKTTAENDIKIYFGHNFKSFLDNVIEFFPSIFINNINSNYEKKLIKRLYSFYNEKIKPYTE